MYGEAAATAGGNSSTVFGAVTVSATGGSFGASYTAGGAGGASGGVGIGGTTNRTGGIGGNGSTLNSGGGGGCAGSASNGGAGFLDAWGAAGDLVIAGDGGDGRIGKSQAGFSGFFYGGGGGGSTKWMDGSAGARGYVRILYTCPAAPVVSAVTDIVTADCSSTTTLVGSAVLPCMTGLWTVVSGTATITTPTSATSGVTGLVSGTTPTLRWTITNPGCGSFSDDVLISVACSTLASDNCGTAVVLVNGGAQNCFSTAGKTMEAGEGTCGALTAGICSYQSVWYKFQATTAETTITLNRSQASTY